MLEFNENPFSECSSIPPIRDTLLASLIRNYRNRYFGHMTAKQFAESIGVDPNKLSKVESGYTLLPSEDFVKQLCEAFATSPRNKTPLLPHYIYKAAQQEILRPDSFVAVTRCIVNQYLSKCEFTHAFLSGFFNPARYTDHPKSYPIIVFNPTNINGCKLTGEQLAVLLPMSPAFSSQSYSMVENPFTDFVIFDEVFAVVNYSYSPEIITHTAIINKLLTIVDQHHSMQKKMKPLMWDVYFKIASNTERHRQEAELRMRMNEAVSKNNFQLLGKLRKKLDIVLRYGPLPASKKNKGDKQ